MVIVTTVFVTMVKHCYTVVTVTMKALLLLQLKWLSLPWH